MIKAGVLSSSPNRVFSASSRPTNAKRLPMPIFDPALIPETMWALPMHSLPGCLHGAAERERERAQATLPIMHESIRKHRRRRRRNRKKDEGRCIRHSIPPSPIPNACLPGCPPSGFPSTVQRVVRENIRQSRSEVNMVVQQSNRELHRPRLL